MWRYQLAWFLWVIGLAVIALSWLEFVTRPLGWIGVALVLAGVVLSYLLRVQPDLTVTPHSVEGYPVEPSDVWVDAVTALEVGMMVLAFSQGRWWRAEIVAFDAGDMVQVRYPGWDPWWVESHLRRDLQQIVKPVTLKVRP